MRVARPRLTFDRGTLLLSGARGGGPPPAGPWQWDPRVGALRCDAMHLAEVRRSMGEAIDDQTPRPPRIAFPAQRLPALRDDQRRALAAWQAAGGRGQIVMPTGTGKTEVALAAMAAAETATLIVAPVRDLMYQWHRRILATLGIEAGVVGDLLMQVRPVTVTTYDSAYLHMDKMGDRFGLVVFDEAHHLPGRCRREAALLCAAPMRLGLTATPERSDGLHADLDSLIGPVVFRMALTEAAGRVLAEYEVLRIPVALAPEERARYDAASRQVRRFMMERRKERPRYDWQDLCAETGSDPEARRVQKAFHLKRSIEDRAEEKLRVLEDLFRLHAGEPVIVFAGSNAMAMDVSRRFLVPTILSFSRRKERHQVLDAFAAGKLPVLVANRVLDEGVDVPQAKVAVVIGGQASARQAQQRLGRVLRRSGGARAILYEVVCEETREEERSRARRGSEAYARTRHRRL